MTKQELAKVFNEVNKQVYSEENIAEVKKRIMEENQLSDNGLQGMQVAFMLSNQLQKDYLFGVLEKVMCEEQTLKFR